MDLDKVEKLFELKKQSVLVGDGQLPLVRDGKRGPLDLESIKEYQRFLNGNTRAQTDLERVMDRDEIFGSAS